VREQRCKFSAPLFDIWLTPRQQCEKEWFHLECVNLTDVPPRTTKWYCPDCRIKLKIGEKGEINARGRKK
jgi:hypothetical protein